MKTTKKRSHKNHQMQENLDLAKKKLFRLFFFCRVMEWTPSSSRPSSSGSNLIFFRSTRNTQQKISSFEYFAPCLTLVWIIDSFFTSFVLFIVRHFFDVICKLLPCAYFFLPISFAITARWYLFPFFPRDTVFVSYFFLDHLLILIRIWQALIQKHSTWLQIQ